MTPIQQNLMNYFINSVNKKEYEFSENVLQTTISIYPKGQSKVNDFWHDCSIDYGVKLFFEKCLKLNTLEFVLNRVDDNMFEDIWLQCKTKEERKEFFNIFDEFLISNDYQFLKNLSSFCNENYLNLLIKKFSLKDSPSSRNDDSLTPILEFFNYSNMCLEPENLVLVCKDNKSYLNKLPMQVKLKEFVEQHMLDHIENFRSYWKKIDSQLIDNQQVVNVYPCNAIGFNKTFIYNLNSGHPVDYYERKLKAINTYLNKEKFKKEYPIESSVFAGIQESKEDYLFIIFGDKPELNFKELLTDFVTHIISINDEATPQILSSALSYIKLAKKTDKIYSTKSKLKI